MVAITCMLVVANVQSSVGEMIPKTSYFKMIDYFLLYSLNVIILVMVYHTYQAAHIAEEFAPNDDDKQLEQVRKTKEQKSKTNFLHYRSSIWLRSELPAARMRKTRCGISFSQR